MFSVGVHKLSFSSATAKELEEKLNRCPEKVNKVEPISGNTPLLIACSSPLGNNSAVIDILMHRGADQSIENFSKSNVLHCSFKAANYSTVELLLRKYSLHFLLLRRDNIGKFPIDYLGSSPRLLHFALRESLTSEGISSACSSSNCGGSGSSCYNRPACREYVSYIQSEHRSLIASFLPSDLQRHADGAYLPPLTSPQRDSLARASGKEGSIDDSSIAVSSPSVTLRVSSKSRSPLRTPVEVLTAGESSLTRTAAATREEQQLIHFLQAACSFGHLADSLAGLLACRGITSIRIMSLLRSANEGDALRTALSDISIVDSHDIDIIFSELDKRSSLLSPPASGPCSPTSAIASPLQLRIGSPLSSPPLCLSTTSWIPMDAHRSCPTLIVALPFIASSATASLNPRYALRGMYRLFFVSSLTRRAVRCGPKGRGFKVPKKKTWLRAAGPLLVASLAVVRAEVVSSQQPTPLSGLGAEGALAAMSALEQCTYLDRVISTIASECDNDHLISIVLREIIGCSAVSIENECLSPAMNGEDRSDGHVRRGAMLPLIFRDYFDSTSAQYFEARDAVMALIGGEAALKQSGLVFAEAGTGRAAAWVEA